MAQSLLSHRTAASRSCHIEDIVDRLVVVRIKTKAFAADLLCFRHLMNFDAIGAGMESKSVLQHCVDVLAELLLAAHELGEAGHIMRSIEAILCCRSLGKAIAPGHGFLVIPVAIPTAILSDRPEIPSGVIEDAFERPTSISQNLCTFIVANCFCSESYAGIGHVIVQCQGGTLMIGHLPDIRGIAGNVAFLDVFLQSNSAKSPVRGLLVGFFECIFEDGFEGTRPVETREQTLSTFHNGICKAAVTHCADH
mmetsp:Transcript_71891/g.127011  ORF Transcript_71891/g.127011 Transcript_71891/m.127011 type:complete len:252 (+) Transcript_71891:383-1138(+)